MHREAFGHFTGNEDMTYAVKRVYEPFSDEDGTRVLVDRLWPRGITKERARIDLWLRAVAPSTELRHWFGHDPEKWQEFQRRYSLELDGHADEMSQLRALGRKQRVTLLFGARDTAHNNAIELLDYLQKHE